MSITLAEKFVLKQAPALDKVASKEVAEFLERYESYKVERTTNGQKFLLISECICKKAKTYLKYTQEGVFSNKKFDEEKLLESLKKTIKILDIFGSLASLAKQELRSIKMNLQIQEVDERIFDYDSSFCCSQKDCLLTMT